MASNGHRASIQSKENKSKCTHERQKKYLFDDDDNNKNICGSYCCENTELDEWVFVRAYLILIGPIPFRSAVNVSSENVAWKNVLVCVARNNINNNKIRVKWNCCVKKKLRFYCLSCGNGCLSSESAPNRFMFLILFTFSLTKFSDC